MNPVGNGLNQGPEEVARDPSGDFLVQLGEGELRGPVNGDEEVEPAFLGVHLGDVDVGKARPATGSRDVPSADRVALELGAPRLVAIGLRQAGDAVALETAMQGGACQVWDGRL
jgi:hypothetical protein